ncbi:MAG TPA: MFS transporter [Solirubrobacteraceae bacterium]|nr:MFS transporter [Solirubrobacteraceae bacterium]
MDTRELLRRPGFRALAITYGLSEVVDWLTTIALAVLVYDATGSAVATTILFVCSKFVPALIAPGATARVDTIAPRRSLPAFYALQCIAFAGMAAFGSHVAPVVALAALAGTAALVSRALVRASVAAVLPDTEELRAGNALLNVIFSVAFAVGPAVAGAAVAALAADAALVGGAALLLAMALYVRVSALPALPVAEHEADDGWWTKLCAGISHLRSQTLVTELFAAQALLLVLFTMVPPIEVVYAREELGTTAAGLGALMAAWGVGAVAGSALFARIGGRGMITVAATATAAMGASYLGMGLASTLPLACVLSAVGGVGNGMQWIAFVTAIQTRVPGELQARAMALVESLGSAVPGVGFVLGGAIAAAASARVAYVVAGTGILTIVVVAALAFRLLPRPGGEPQPA